MLNVLVSYAYIKKSPTVVDRMRACGPHVRWLIDSGAFTAFQQGEHIGVDEYCDFLDQTKDLWWKYIALDVLGDPAATWVNLEKMRARGLDPMPVLVVNAHLDDAPQLARETDALCVAGGVTEPLELYGPRIAETRRRVGPDVWLHGLGFTRGLRTSGTQVDSVDSSSWLAGKRFGRFCWYDPMRGVKFRAWKRMRTEPFSKLPPLARKALMGLKLSSEDINDPAMNTGGKSMLAFQGVAATLAYASALQNRGVKYFFAMTAPDFFPLLLGARNATQQGVRWENCKADIRALKCGALSVEKLAATAAATTSREWGIE